MLFPYRVKNPIKHFPFATIALIATNVIVYYLTSDNLLGIREDVVENYAFALGKTPFLTFISAAFLHGDLLHLIGNMWFLWLFGPPVEDRLRIPRYLAVYMATGLSGDLLQAAFDIAVGGETRPIIGASGCIMGILGAYWYIYSWSTVCVFYWFGIIWHGVWEVAALWIVGLYLMLDLLQGSLIGSVGVQAGIAYFAHVGGGFSAVVICLLLRIQRDTEAMSEAKALQADMKDLALMPLHSLQTMLEQEPTNPEIIRALTNAAMQQNMRALVDHAMLQAGPGLIEKDPQFVGYYLTSLNGTIEPYSAVHLLRLAGQLERLGDPAQAVAVYQLILQHHPSATEAEMALYRMALCYWDKYNDADSARNCMREMAKRFPRGNLTPYGRTLWNRINEQQKQ